MRILKVGIYILAALATCELSHEANATSSFKLSTKKLEVSNFAAVNNTVTPLLEAQGHKRAGDFPPLHPCCSKASDLAQVTNFSDIQGSWARRFIEALVARNIIQGFPDGTFRPNAPVTRAQFAAMIRKAFHPMRSANAQSARYANAFVDVPPYDWAREAIQLAYQTGFLQGYPNKVFLPNQNIPRVQVLVSLVNGLNLSATATTPTVLNTYFKDASQIPHYAHDSVAAATEKRIVVNYPNIAYLKPNQVATRADVAAFIYQALVSTGKVPPLAPSIASQYIVGQKQTTFTLPPPPTNSTTKAPSSGKIQDLQSQLRTWQQLRNFSNVMFG